MREPVALPEGTRRAPVFRAETRKAQPCPLVSVLNMGHQVPTGRTQPLPTLGQAPACGHR